MKPQFGVELVFTLIVFILAFFTSNNLYSFGTAVGAVMLFCLLVSVIAPKLKKLELGRFFFRLFISAFLEAALFALVYLSLIFIIGFIGFQGEAFFQNLSKYQPFAYLFLSMHSKFMLYIATKKDTVPERARKVFLGSIVSAIIVFIISIAVTGNFILSILPVIPLIVGNLLYLSAFEMRREITEK